jgi:hypothetical protein
MRIPRPPIKTNGATESKQPKIELRMSTPQTVHLPKVLIFHMIKHVEKNIKYAKTKKTTYFWGPGGVTLSKKRVVQRTALIHTPVFWRVKAFLCNVVCT